jgi:hypothetical protein
VQQGRSNRGCSSGAAAVLATLRADLSMGGDEPSLGGPASELAITRDSLGDRAGCRRFRAPHASVAEESEDARGTTTPFLIAADSLRRARAVRVEPKLCAESRTAHRRRRARRTRPGPGLAAGPRFVRLSSFRSAERVTLGA